MLKSGVLMVMSKGRDAERTARSLWFRLMNIPRDITLALKRVAASYHVFDRRLGYSDDLSASLDELRGYWRVYGGAKALIKSPIFWLAIVIDLFCLPLWADGKWSDITISVLPNLLGFSIGAMAVVLGFPSSPLFKVFIEGGRQDSYYIGLAAKFVHFIISQVFAILISIIGKAYPINFLGFIGLAVTIYAVLTAIMVALSLFGVAEVHNHPATPYIYEGIGPTQNDPNKPDSPIANGYTD